MSVLIFGTSRYRYRPLKRDGTVLRIPFFRGILKVDYDDNLVIRLKASDRLDLISYQLYGESKYDWILATFNNIRYPLADLKTLDTIIAPSRETLFNIVLPALERDYEGQD